MVSALDFGSSDPGSSPGRDTALCSWAKHFTLVEFNTGDNPYSPLQAVFSENNLR